MRRLVLLSILGVMGCGNILEGDVSISPAMPRTGDDLVATAMTGAKDVAFRWSQNGAVRTDITGDTVDHGLTTRGDTWTVDLLSQDSQTIATSAAVTVVNTPPTAPAVMLTPDQVVPAGDVQCVVAAPAMDDDGDPVTYAASWTDNGAAFTGTATTTTFAGDTIQVDGIAVGDSIQCTVTASDGTDVATATSSSVVGACVTGGMQMFAVNGTPPTGQLQTFTVPAGVCHVTIEAGGAEGGITSTAGATRGARITGDFDVFPGEQLQILVGQQAGPTTNGQRLSGGGGTFVLDSSNQPLIVAGGGGSVFLGSLAPEESVGRAVTSGGTAGTTPRADNGNGGNVVSGTTGGGGGGLLTDGQGPGAGKSYAHGGTGGGTEASGGFGGGGGRTGAFGEGGGGGYSGGSCGDTASTWVGCGGGGSFNAGMNQVNTAGAVSGDGYVKISW